MPSTEPQPIDASSVLAGSLDLPAPPSSETSSMSPPRPRSPPPFFLPPQPGRDSANARMGTRARMQMDRRGRMTGSPGEKETQTGPGPSAVGGPGPACGSRRLLEFDLGQLGHAAGLDGDRVAVLAARRAPADTLVPDDEVERPRGGV